MLLFINPAQTVLQMQKAFREAFPYLKLEFFLQRAGWQTGPPLKASPVIETGAIQSGRAEGTILVNPCMTVKELEDILHEQYFLDAQVFRKAGNTWLETTATDHWTLGQQNERGAQSDLRTGKTFVEMADYDLSRDTAA